MSRFNLSQWAVKRPTLMLFLMIAISIAGAMSYVRLGRAEDPSFTIKIAVVTAYWPGATSKDMRDQLGDVVEKKIQELPYLDKIETYVKPGFLAMQVVLKDSTPAKEVPTLFYQLRKKLYDIKAILPQGVIGPNVNDEFGDVDTVLYAVSGEGVDFQLLDKVVERMRQRLLEVPDATKIDVVGKQARLLADDIYFSCVRNLQKPLTHSLDNLVEQLKINPLAAHGVKHRINIAKFIINVWTNNPLRQNGFDVVEFFTQLIEKRWHFLSRRRVLQHNLHGKKAWLHISFDFIEIGQLLDFLLNNIAKLITHIF